jgi:HEAT repeat protein
MQWSGTWRLVCLAAAVALVGASAGCAGLSSRQHLIQTARTAPVQADRRAALAELKGRTQPWMREDLEAVLAQELDPTSRAAAADLLGEIGDAASAPELRRSALTDTRWLVRQRALDALAKVQGTGAAADIQNALHSDPDPEVRREAAVLARKYLTQADATPLLLAALRDHSTVVRLQAGAMLEELTGLHPAPDAESWQKALAAAQKP